jgi:hypothetical protein
MDDILAATRAALISLFGIHLFIAPECDIGAAFAAPILLLSVGLLTPAANSKHSRNPAASPIAPAPLKPHFDNP